MGLLRQIVQEPVQELDDLGAIVDQVPVIQDAGEVVGDALDDVRHHRTGGPSGCNGPLFQQLVGLVAKVGEPPTQAGGEIGQEDAQIPIALVQGVPADRDLRIGAEVHQKCGLAVAGRGRDDDQFAVQMFVDEVEQPLPAQDL